MITHDLPKTGLNPWSTTFFRLSSLALIETCFAFFVHCEAKQGREKHEKLQTGTILKKISWFNTHDLPPPTTLQCRCLKHLHKYEFVRWKTAMLLFKTWFKHMIYQTNWFKPMIHHLFQIIFTCFHWYLFCFFTVKKSKEKKNMKNCRPGTILKKISQGWFKHLIYFFCGLNTWSTSPPNPAMLLFKTWLKHMIYQTNWFKPMIHHLFQIIFTSFRLFFSFPSSFWFFGLFSLWGKRRKKTTKQKGREKIRKRTEKKENDRE